MNIHLLQPALQRIINAVDELPDKSSRHFPKTVLDAVENAKVNLARAEAMEPTAKFVDKLVTAMDRPDKPGMWQARNWLGWTQCKVVQGNGELCGTLDLPSAKYSPISWLRTCGYREWMPVNNEHVAESTAKQRITLRGGPLDGCWYLQSVTETERRFGNIGFTLRWPDWGLGTIFYSLPDAAGICYYRE